MFDIVNIKKDKPDCEYAIFLAEKEIEYSKKEGKDILILIHGYGASGVGGAIKKELHIKLNELVNKGKIKSYFPGECFSLNNLEVEKICKKYPNLLVDQFLNLNPGVTIINISL